MQHYYRSSNVSLLQKIRISDTVIMSMKNSPRHQRKLERKARRIAEQLGRFMGVRAIFLSGSLAQGCAHKKSDIDFFFIAEKNRIWTARFFVFLWLKFRKEISTPENHAEKICPNHFITDDSLEIQEKDAYSAHLFSHNVPLYDPDNLFPLFAQKNQHWVQEFGQSFEPDILKKKVKPPVRNTHSARFIALLEWILKFIQKIKIYLNPESRIPGSKIILSDDELRFHPHPKNKNFFEPPPA